MLSSDIITSVQNLLQDDQFPSIQILEASNWVQDQLFNNNNTRIMEVSDVLTASAGDTTMQYPDNMRTVEMMYLVEPTQQDMEDMYVDYKDFVKRYPNFSTNPPSQLLYYTNFAYGMRFSAPLLTDITVNIDFIRNPVPMVNLTDVCEIPDNYRELTSRLTLARCMEQNEDYTEAANERNIVSPLLTTFIRRESVGMQKTGPIQARMRRRTTGWRH